VVAGDVSGKGLDAAMVVATVIGALRNEFSRSPAEVLTHLNRSLLGRARGGFVTCVCALFHPDGCFQIANAGHLLPFLGGREIDLESNLPLGIVIDVAYLEVSMKIGEETLTFLSDGVVEAANTKGELFGFDRTRKISGKTAKEIAEAARAWGQNDDITVVTVRRNA
jgi:sigma-B regulation protein RsbU (phosphoserine phosphatase)